MKKYFLGVVFICFIFLLGYEFDILFAKEELCTIKISSDDSKMILKDVEFDIYVAELYDSDEDAGTCVYSETFYKNLSSDQNGIVRFNRPSGTFSVEVKLKTLPKGYGTPLKTFFFDDETNECIFKLEKISEVDVKVDFSDPVTQNHYSDSVICYGKDSQILIADAKINSKKIYIENTSCIKNDIERDLYLKYKYSISVSGTTYEVVKYNTLHCRSRLEKAEYLKKTGYLTIHDYMNELAWSLIYFDEYMDTDYQDECGTYKLGLLSSYRDSHQNRYEDFSFIDKVLSQYGVTNGGYGNNLISDRLRSLAYVDSPSGKFRVYYDTTSSITSTMASSIASRYDTIDAIFCTNLGYSRPFNPSTSKFEIKITGTSDVAKMVPNNGSPYIELSVGAATNIANLTGITGFPNAYNGVAAHEYFHAIMYKQGIPVNESWMHECFASWAGLAYTTDYAAYRKNQVKTFLLTPTLSLTDNSVNYRIYGTCVLPLYIQKTLGYAVIKKIINSYTSSTGALGAVSNGLNYYGSSLTEAYSGCASWNYDTDYYYQMPVAGTYYSWGEADKTQVGSSSYPYNITGTLLPGLASKYIEFAGPNTPDKLTVTIDFTNAYGGPASGIKVIRTKNSGEHNFINATISSGRCTIIQNSFGDTNAKKIAIIPMNVSSSGWLAISASAVLG